MKLGEMVLCPDCNAVFHNSIKLCPDCGNRLNLVPVQDFINGKLKKGERNAPIQNMIAGGILIPFDPLERKKLAKTMMPSAKASPQKAPWWKRPLRQLKEVRT